MKDENVFGQLKFWRRFLMDELNEVSDDDCYRTPEGYPNNLLWNAGHILVINDSYLATLAGGEKQLEKQYSHWFSRGTSPADWGDELPELQDVLAKLEEQTSGIQTAYSGKLRHKVTRPLENVETVEELLCFLISHECYHLGVMRSMKRLL